MSDELQPRAVPRPVTGPGELRPDQLPGEGRPPMSQGRTIMTDHTRQQLTAVGWKDGDPIPGDLGARLREIQLEVEAERSKAKLAGSELAAGWKPVQPNFVNITDLPPERQAEIQQHLQAYKAEVNQQSQLSKEQAEVDASIPANIQGEQREIMRETILQSNAAAAARAARPQSDRGDVIDDRVQSAAAAAPASRPPQPPPAVVDDLPATGAVQHPADCPRCAWPLAVPFEVVPTLADKQGFMSAILGLGRFEKPYELLGGNLVVFFRSLSSAEAMLIQQQMGAMVRSGESRGDVEYWANLREFRLVLSVSRISVGGNVMYSMPLLEEWVAANPPPPDAAMLPTPLPRVRDYFYAKGATQEPLRRIIGQAQQEFQRLVEALEVMTSNPDFWQGIALRG